MVQQCVSGEYQAFRGALLTVYTIGTPFTPKCEIVSSHRHDTAALGGNNDDLKGWNVRFWGVLVFHPHPDTSHELRRRPKINSEMRQAFFDSLYISVQHI